MTLVVGRVAAADEEAFRQLVEPHRRELEVHCYRILGSLEDAEDATQETLASAWQGLASFKGNASIRTWLYRIATNRCLDMLRSARRRPDMTSRSPEVPEPNATGEVTWVGPYPDSLLTDLPDAAPGPEARFEQREAISLAFITALQLLPPRQRVVLVLRDVLGFRGREVAEMFNATEESVSSALKRARATLQKRVPKLDEASPPPESGVEQEIVDRFLRAYESGDVPGVVALLSEDAVLTTPLSAAQYAGRAVCARFFEKWIFGQGRAYRLVLTHANGQPAFGVYIKDPRADVAHAHGMWLLTLRGGEITRMTRFDNSVISHFDLPRTMAKQ